MSNSDKDRKYVAHIIYFDIAKVVRNIEIHIDSRWELFSKCS